MQQPYVSVIVLFGASLMMYVSAADPMVTLKHGGKLESISYNVKSIKVDHFVSKY